jgi:hypothetical protein
MIFDFERFSPAISDFHYIIFDEPSFLKGAPGRPAYIIGEPGVDRPPDSGANGRDSLQDFTFGDIQPQSSLKTIYIFNP